MEETKGFLFPTFDEIDYYRENFLEGAEMLGRTGNIYLPVDTKIDLTDWIYNYDSPIPVSYYLVDNPQPRLLQKYGWYVEEKSRLPIVCYMTYLSKEYNSLPLQEGAILEISIRESFDSELYKSRRFLITAPQVDFEMHMFVCQLVPYEELQKPRQPIPTPEDPVNDNKYFKRKEYNVDDLIPMSEVSD